MSRGQKTMNIRSGKGWLRRSITIIVMVGALAGGYFLANYLFSIWQDHEEVQFIESLGISTEPATPTEVDDYRVDPDKPRYMSIPAANVNKARTVALGVKNPPKGSETQQLDAPTNIGDIGWYNCQINPIANKRCQTPKRPGDGNTEVAALFDAHTCFSRNLSCVFDEISKLHRGDTVTIELGDGQKLNYQVAKVEILNLADVDMDRAMKPLESGREGITLITCAGRYKGAIDASGVPTASKRVLVYAVLG